MGRGWPLRKLCSPVKNLGPWSRHPIIYVLHLYYDILFCGLQSIFSNIKERLQNSAMKLVHNERNGEAFDSQLVIGVRESYVNLCSNPQGNVIN